MSRKAGVPVALEEDRLLQEAGEYYREIFGRPAALPDGPFPPSRIGPTWQITDDGNWVLPDLTLGWQCLFWCYAWLEHEPGEPWKFTPEQARFLMHWYALDGQGRWIYRNGVLQRLKGWGKDPLGACICAFEMLGPCRFDGWDDGYPRAKPVRGSWVQTAAVALSQTRNTMQLFDIGLFSEAAIKRYRITPGVEIIRGAGGARIEAVTSSPKALQGNRGSFVLCNETHEWDSSNGGHRMSEVLRANAAKAGSARTLRITNAYMPGMDSVAEKDREEWERATAGGSLTTGWLYDSLEAPPEAPLTAKDARSVIPAVRGDSTWLEVERIVEEILDTRNPPSVSRRYWYNQITAAEDAWTTPQKWDANRDESLTLEEGDQGVLFFDGSKSDDATGLVFSRISDGAVFVLGVWQRPDNIPEWTVPRDKVRDIVARAFALYDVRAMFADPGAGEDETGQRYWDAVIDEWAQEYGDRLDLWSVQSGADRHAILWDMRSPARNKLFTEACERALSDIEAEAFPHNGNLILRMHVTNARRRPNQYGISIGKEHRESKRKIDLAVCAIGARMLRRMWEAMPDNKKRRKRTGRAMFAG